MIVNPLKHFEEDITCAIGSVSRDYPIDLYILQLEIECNKVVKHYTAKNRYSHRESRDLNIIARRKIQEWLL